MRYALLIDYDGRTFAGWQRQASLPSVQGALEAAAARLDPGGPAVFGAGRTDAGVHATGQVAHLDMGRAWDFQTRSSCGRRCWPSSIPSRTSSM